MFLHIVRKADIFNNYFGCKKREFFPTCFFTVTIIPTRVYYIKKNNFLRFTFRSGNNSINETHRWRFLCGFCLTCRDSARDNIERKSNGSTAVQSVVLCRTLQFSGIYLKHSRCVSSRKSKIGFLHPKRILRFLTKQINPRPLGSLCIKGTEESLPRVDSLVPLTHNDPRDLGLIFS